MNDTDFQRNSPCFHCAFHLLDSWAHLGEVRGLWRLLQPGVNRGTVVNSEFTIFLLRLCSNQLQCKKGVSSSNRFQLISFLVWVTVIFYSPRWVSEKFLWICTSIDCGETYFNTQPSSPHLSFMASVMVSVVTELKAWGFLDYQEWRLRTVIWAVQLFILER